MRTIEIGYGFRTGINNIYKWRIQKWLHVSEDINWKAYVWYIAQYFDVDDFGIDWIRVKIWDGKQREQFYQRSKEYNNQIWSHNYINDIKNGLYNTHHRGYERNKAIIARLVYDE